MGPGVTLTVVGAILTFAVRVQPSWIDLRVVGLVLMVAGATLIWHAWRGSRSDRVVTRVERSDPSDGTTGRISGSRTVRETYREHD